MVKEGNLRVYLGVFVIALAGIVFGLMMNENGTINVQSSPTVDGQFHDAQEVNVVLYGNNMNLQDAVNNITQVFPDENNIDVVEYYSEGNAIWTVPSVIVDGKIKVELIGGGGSGGIGSIANIGSCGGGGGSGGYTSTVLNVTSGQKYSISVGKGGDALLGVAFHNGSQSNFSGNGITLRALGGGIGKNDGDGGIGAVGNKVNSQIFVGNTIDLVKSIALPGKNGADRNVSLYQYPPGGNSFNSDKYGSGGQGGYHYCYSVCINPGPKYCNGWGTTCEDSPSVAGESGLVRISYRIPNTLN